MASPIVMNKMEFHHFMCRCTSPSCTVRLIIDQDAQFEPVLEFKLDVWAPWWKRIIFAYRYITGHNPSPEYGSCILDPDGIDRMISVLQQAKRLQETK